MNILILDKENNRNKIKNNLTSLDFIGDIKENDRFEDLNSSIKDMDVLIINSQFIKESELTKVIEFKHVILIDTDINNSFKYFKLGVYAIINNEKDDNQLQNSLIKLESEIQETESEILCLFNDLHLKNNNEIINLFWRTNKIKELFLYLFQNKNKVVTNLELINLLWPELSGEKALKQLYTSIYNVRNTIEKYDVKIEIVKLSNGYSLTAPNLKTDVEIMLAGFDEIKEINEANVDQYLSLIKMYQGGYLESEEFDWAFNERSRLQAIWLMNVLRLVEYYKSIDSKLDMVLIYLKLQKYIPYYEESYLELIKLWKELGNKNASDIQKEKLEKIRK